MGGRAEAGVPWTEDALLEALRGRGAPFLERVGFRDNRRTIWSITGGGRRLNLHAAYRRAPGDVLLHFAVLLREVRRGRRSGDYHRAAGVVGRWPGVVRGVLRARRRPRKRSGGGRPPPVPGPCCGTPEQLEWLRSAYRHLARSRFRGVLPEDVHLRLSRAMTARLGHMRGDREAGPSGPRGGGARRVVEIALSLDLMLPGNERALLETLLHEMAHAADWLERGGRGHGATWRAWAARVGCSDRARCGGRILRREDRGTPVERVPDAPAAALVARVVPGPG